jgi:hypothetical protein
LKSFDSKRLLITTNFVASENAESCEIFLVSVIMSQLPRLSLFFTFTVKNADADIFRTTNAFYAQLTFIQQTSVTLFNQQNNGRVQGWF